jgi:hypothetical protein
MSQPIKPAGKASSVSFESKRSIEQDDITFVESDAPDSPPRTVEADECPPSLKPLSVDAGQRRVSDAALDDRKELPPPQDAFPDPVSIPVPDIPASSDRHTVVFSRCVANFLKQRVRVQDEAGEPGTPIGTARKIAALLAESFVVMAGAKPGDRLVWLDLTRLDREAFDEIAKVFHDSTFRGLVRAHSLKLGAEISATVHWMNNYRKRSCFFPTSWPARLKLAPLDVTGKERLDMTRRVAKILKWPDGDSAVVADALLKGVCRVETPQGPICSVFFKPLHDVMSKEYDLDVDYVIELLLHDSEILFDTSPGFPEPWRDGFDEIRFVAPWRPAAPQPASR